MEDGTGTGASPEDGGPRAGVHRTAKTGKGIPRKVV